MSAQFELALVGPAGEPVDPRWTLAASWMQVPPLRADSSAWWLEVPVLVGPGRVRLVRAEPAGTHRMRVSVLGGPCRRADAVAAHGAVRRCFALDVDLSGFYQRAEADPDLSWVTAGAGRIGRSPRVYDDVIKTLCTVNCSWRATHRMVATLVARLGTRAGNTGTQAFPTATSMASVGEGFYRDVVRAGYRAPWLAGLAARAAGGEVDLEALASPDLPDAEVEARLRALPGFGPYATAHVMQLLGRFSQLVLDSWTRPTYGRLTGQRTVRDEDVRARFAGYGPWAGLAFWLFCHHHGTFR